MQSAVVYRRDFWKTENLKYDRPHLRLERVARLINQITQGREMDLLDIGCGPATLRRLLQKNIHYYGIDIAIHEPSPNLVEADFVENPIKFGDKRFDLIIAQGVFEYVGAHQRQKFAEIAQLLNAGGVFIASYNNFGHLNKHISPAYSNIQTISEFKTSLSCFFDIRRSFPTAHHWRHREPGRRLSKSMQMMINVHIPFISPRFAIQYLFVCRRASTKGRSGW
jgi:SAM-dependent methyltransferase